MNKATIIGFEEVQLLTIGGKFSVHSKTPLRFHSVMSVDWFMLSLPNFKSTLDSNPQIIVNSLFFFFLAKKIVNSLCFEEIHYFYREFLSCQNIFIMLLNI